MSCHFVFLINVTNKNFNQIIFHQNTYKLIYCAVILIMNYDEITIIKFQTYFEKTFNSKLRYLKHLN